jgi:hypothetical protein
MSAWIVSAHHIDALAEAATRPNSFGVLRYRYKGRIRECSSPTTVGRILLRECVESVRYRYSDDTDETLPGSSARPETYYYRPPAEFPPIVLLKAVDCYEYQSCEHPGWRKSEAFAICNALRDRLLVKLPGYDAAPWGIEDEERTSTPIPFNS